MGPTCPNMNDPRVREMAQQWEQAARAYSQQGQAWQPRPTSDMLLSVDMVESADNYTFYADVPGLQKQDLSVSQPPHTPATPLTCASAQAPVQMHSSRSEAVSPMQIRINQQERRLTLSGERTEPEVTGPGSEADNRKRYERPHGKFSRSVQLPADADPKGVTARSGPNF